MRGITGALGILLAGVAGRPCSFALNPALDVSQYAHTGWTVRGGFFKGTIVAIAQTQDGYLWLGTEFGLLRFDGVRYVPWEPPFDQHLPNSAVRKPACLARWYSLDWRRGWVRKLEGRQADPLHGACWTECFDAP